MKEIFFNKYYILIISFIIISCSSNKQKLVKRKPSKNIIMLEKIKDKNFASNIQENQIPITKPQYAQQNNQNNKKSFYQTLFTNKKNLIIKDEIANNNIKNLKKTIKQKAKKENFKENIVKNNNYFFVQVGAYSVQDNANKTLLKLQQKYSKIQTEKSLKNSQELTKIKIGPLTSLVEAEEVKKQLSNEGFNKTIIIHNK